MNLRGIGLAWYLAALAISPCFGASEDLGAYLDPKGNLRDRLVLEDSQSGFAGVIRDIWTIETDGTFAIERFHDTKPVAKSIALARTGTLAPDDLKSIAMVLATQGFRSFSSEIGSSDKINPRWLQLTFGEQTTKLWLPANATVSRLPCVGEIAGGFGGPATVAAAIVTALGTLEKQPATGSEGKQCE